MVRDIQAQKRTSGMSLESNPGDMENALQSALSSARNSQQPRGVMQQGFRRGSILEDLRRPSNIYALSEEASSEGWLSSVTTPVAIDHYSEEEEVTKQRAPPPPIKVTTENSEF